VVVARQGERATPVVAAPSLLRRYLNFARLPDPALEVARRVLDDDDAFRRRVADAYDEGAVGRAGWLFLHRPVGWLEELDQLLQQAAAAEIAAKDERHERGAQRRLAGAEAALARAETAAQASAAEVAAARADLEAERRARIALAAQLQQARAEVERLQGERTEAIRRLKAAEATGVERSAELRAARHELRMVQAELTQAVPDLAARAAAPATSDPGIDREVVSELIADAAAAAAALQQALAALEAVAVRPGPGPAEPARPTERTAVARRRPVALPPAVLDDSPEAADHLVRVSGVLLLVDGYNISHAQWHGLAPPEQRTRLLDACAELHARCGAELEVVFDGAGEQAGGGTLVRSAVRYRFTPNGTEADDVILDRVDHEPPARPVVVVSSDRRVRDGARERGANVLGARQFLHLLRR
jgi:predicted RNA-binding protein with PIN domain